MPIARAMPISERRSAASMMKVRKISMIPAAIEKRPKTRKKVTNTDPISSASATASALSEMTCRGSPCSVMTVSTRSRSSSASSSVPRTPPVAEMTTRSTWPGSPVISHTRSIGATIPPAARPLVMAVAAVSALSRTTSRTVKSYGSFCQKTRTVSPGSSRMSSASDWET